MQSSSESDARVAQAIQTCMGAMNGLSNRETAMVLRALGGMNNLVVQLPAQVAARNQTGQATERRSAASGTGKGVPRPNPANKDPKVLELKKILQDLQEQIRREAKSTEVDKLPEDHPLVQRRDELLTQIRSFRDQAPPVQTEQVKGQSPAPRERVGGSPTGSHQAGGEGPSGHSKPV